MKVYIAMHVRNEEQSESRKIIGVFSSQVKAHRAIDTLAAGLTGESDDFDYPDFFHVDAYELDGALFREKFALSA
jgi:hypothetical protein